MFYSPVRLALVFGLFIANQPLITVATVDNSITLAFEAILVQTDNLEGKCSIGSDLNDNFTQTVERDMNTALTQRMGQAYLNESISVVSCNVTDGVLVYKAILKTINQTNAGDQVITAIQTSSNNNSLDVPIQNHTIKEIDVPGAVSAEDYSAVANNALYRYEAAVSMRITSETCSVAKFTKNTEQWRLLEEVIVNECFKVIVRDHPNIYFDNSFKLNFCFCFEDAVIANITFDTTSRDNGGEMLAESLIRATNEMVFGSGFTLDKDNIQEIMTPTELERSLIVLKYNIFFAKITVPAFIGLGTALMLCLLLTAGKNAYMCRICNNDFKDFDKDFGV